MANPKKDLPRAEQAKPENDPRRRALADDLKKWSEQAKAKANELKGNK